MASADNPDRDDAAEYALGTLDAAERTAFEARMAADPALAAEAAAWQDRLATLHAETEPTEPPAHLFADILRRLDDAAPNNVVMLKRSADLWRRATIAVSAIAAALLIAIAVRAPWQQPEQKGLYVAVLQGQGTQAAYVAAVDVKSKMMIVRSLGARAPDAHSYELWALGAGRAAPQPLGVIEAVARMPSEQLGRTSEAALSDTTLAISLEPVGGSPTGAPTGPVLFTGKLLPAN
jgi:anti-sigma-K factor RskA